MILILGLTTENAYASTQEKGKNAGKTLYFDVSKEYNAQFGYVEYPSGKPVVKQVKPGEAWNFPNGVSPNTTVNVKVMKGSSSIINRAYAIGNGLTIVCNSTNMKIIGAVCSCNGTPCATN